MYFELERVALALVMRESWRTVMFKNKHIKAGAVKKNGLERLD